MSEFREFLGEQEYEKFDDLMKPIVEVFMGELQTKFEEDVLKVVYSYDIDVDKERLIRALEDARSFWEEGYEAGSRRSEGCPKCSSEYNQKFVALHVRYHSSTSSTSSSVDVKYCPCCGRKLVD